MRSAREFKVIAIDGPAGSGKSTTAQLVAKKLGYIHLDTGAMYRALTYKVLQEKVNPDSASSVEKVMQRANLGLEIHGARCKILLGGKDVSSRIRAKAVEENVSKVSRYPAIRKRMVELQREVSHQGNLVIEGRDTATVVFPDADLKIYLEAGLEERAKRRLKARRLAAPTLADQKKMLLKRDRIDSTRPVAPLRRSPESFRIDTTNLSIDQQVQKVLQLYRLKVDPNQACSTP